MSKLTIDYVMSKLTTDYVMSKLTTDYVMSKFTVYGIVNFTYVYLSLGVSHSQVMEKSSFIQIHQRTYV